MTSAVGLFRAFVLKKQGANKNNDDINNNDDNKSQGVCPQVKLWMGGGSCSACLLVFASISC